jgi:hypothetical protein
MVYHVLNRGNGRMRIFHKPEDFEVFSDPFPTLTEYKQACTSDFPARLELSNSLTQSRVTICLSSLRLCAFA